LRQINSKSLQKEFARLIETQVIYRAALSLGVSKVILPDNAEVLANVAFSALCFARSASMSSLTDVVDKRHPQLQLIRPLRDICDKEISLINTFENNASYTIAPRENTGGGIQSLTSDFMQDLQANGFSATLTTVLSVASKVTALKRGSVQCAFCLDAFTDGTLHQAMLNGATERFCSACRNILSETDASVRHSVVDAILAQPLHT
jgi:hypothetical protein